MLDVLVQDHRDTAAAERFFRRLPGRAGGPPDLTDGLASYGAAKARLPKLAHFRARRHLLAASEHHTVRHIRYAAWRELSGTLGLHA